MPIITNNQLRELIAFKVQHLAKINQDHLSFPSIMKEELSKEIELLKSKLTLKKTND